MTDPPLLLDAATTTVAVDATGAARERLERDWSRCLTAAPTDVAATLTAPSDLATLADAFVERLVARVTELAIEAGAGRSLMLHAAAASDPDGRVIALLAPSGGGKTTAVQALGRAGWGYVTDELLVCGADASATAYPKPLSLVGGGAAKLAVSPDELGLPVCPPRLRVARLVALRRGPAGTPASARRVDPATALTTLIEQSCALLRLPDPLWTLARLVARCGVWEVRYAEVDEAIPLLDGLMASAPDGEVWDRLPLEGATLGRGWSRVRVADAVGWSTGAAFLVGGRPVFVGTLERHLWTLLDEPRSTSSLVRSVARTEPHPPADLGERVTRSLTLMADAGLLGQGRG